MTQHIVTYWLKRERHFYALGHNAYVCNRFVDERLPRQPKWIKLTVSPVQKPGFTKCSLTNLGEEVILNDRHFVDAGLTTALTRDIANLITEPHPHPQLSVPIWFKLTVWK